MITRWTNGLPPIWLATAATAALAFVLSLAVPLLYPDDPRLFAFPLLLMVAVALVPLGMGLIAGERWAYVVALAALIFLTDSSFRTRGWGEKSVDWQVMMKGMMWLGCGLAGLLRLPHTIRLLGRPPAWLVALYLLIAWASTVWSPMPRYTFLAASGYICLFGFALAAAQVLDARSLLLAIVLGYGAIVLPSAAIAPFATGFTAPSPGSTGAADRLRGLSDHPIALAIVSSFFVYAALSLWRLSRGIGVRIVLGILALTGVAVIVLTQSRTPPMAMVAAVTIYLAYRKGGALLAVPALVVTLGGVALMESAAGIVNVVPSDILESLSRTATRMEILTLSGRTEIWSYVLDQVREAPWLGHGFAAGREIFKGFYAWKITHAHNAYLQALLYVGIIGATALFAAILAQIKVFAVRPEAPRDILMIYAVLTGITEQSMASNLPPGGTILWMVAVGLAAKAWRGAEALARSQAPQRVAQRPISVQALPGHPQ